MPTELVSSSPRKLAWAYRGPWYDPVTEEPALALNDIYSDLEPNEVLISSFDRESGYDLVPQELKLDLTTTYAISDLVPNEVFISSFVSENKKYHIYPPLKFLWNSDSETKMFEVSGVEPYQDILVYGETIEVATGLLEKEILPILWEEHVNGDDVKLSPNAQKIKDDLIMRVTG